MHHGLLVAKEKIRKLRGLLQRLAHASYVTMAKDPKAPRKEGLLFAITLDILRLQIANQRLSHG